MRQGQEAAVLKEDIAEDPATLVDGEELATRPAGENGGVLLDRNSQDRASISSKGSKGSVRRDDSLRAISKKDSSSSLTGGRATLPAVPGVVVPPSQFNPPPGPELDTAHPEQSLLNGPTNNGLPAANNSSALSLRDSQKYRPSSPLLSSTNMPAKTIVKNGEIPTPALGSPIKTGSGAVIDIDDLLESEIKPGAAKGSTKKVRNNGSLESDNNVLRIAIVSAIKW